MPKIRGGAYNLIKKPKRKPATKKTKKSGGKKKRY